MSLFANEDNAGKHLMAFPETETFDEFDLKVREMRHQEYAPRRSGVASGSNPTGAASPTDRSSGLASGSDPTAAASSSTDRMPGLASSSTAEGAQTMPGLKPKSKAARKPQQFSRMVGPLKIAAAARKRRGQANCSEKPYTEMTEDEFLEHSAKSRIMAEHSEFHDYNPDNASAELTERFDALVEAKKHDIQKVYLEECLSQDDGTVVIDVEDKPPTTPYSWVNMSYVVSNWNELAIALDQDPARFDCINYIKSIWYSEGFNTWDVIRTAFEQVKPEEVIRLNWQPIANVDHPSEAPSVLNQVPATCGIADGENYFHGVNPLNLPSIAQFGLHPSEEGAGSPDEPVLYTCKTRKTPIDI